MKHCKILTPADFPLWGFFKENVYSHNPKNLEDIKHKTEQNVTDTDRKKVSKTCKNPVKRVIAYLQNDADIFSINSNYIFVSHSWCLQKNQNENKYFTLLGCF